MRVCWSSRVATMSTASAAMEARILWFLTHFERSVCFAASNRAFLSVPAGKNTMSCEHTSLNRFDSCASSSDEVFSILWFNRVEQGGNKLDFRSILGAEYASRNCSKVCAVVTRDGRFWTVDEITGVVNAEYDIIGEARERRLRRLFEVEVHNGTHVAFRSLANGRYIVVAGGAVSPVGSVGAGTPGGGTTGSGGASTLLDEILGSTAPTPPVPIGSVSCSSTTASVQCLFQPFVKVRCFSHSLTHSLTHSFLYWIRAHNQTNAHAGFDTRLQQSSTSVVLGHAASAAGRGWHASARQRRLLRVALVAHLGYRYLRQPVRASHAHTTMLT